MSIRSHADCNLRLGPTVGWEALDASGVEPVFIEKDQAIGYAETHARFRTGEILIFDSTGNVERELRLTTPIADCDGDDARHLAFPSSFYGNGGMMFIGPGRFIMSNFDLPN